MKLLLDHNLSHRLLTTLAQFYPGSKHVADLGMSIADDNVIWNYAHEQNMMIVSKDSDFYYRSILLGAPPKVSGLGWGIAPLVKSPISCAIGTTTYSTFGRMAALRFLRFLEDEVAGLSSPNFMATRLMA